MIGLLVELRLSKKICSQTIGSAFSKDARQMATARCHDEKHEIDHQKCAPVMHSRLGAGMHQGEHFFITQAHACLPLSGFRSLKRLFERPICGRKAVNLVAFRCGMMP
nr:hypothetical protein [Mesorhizobium loti]